MVKMTLDEMEQAEQEICLMEYRTGEYFDPWYPTYVEVVEHLTDFKRADVLFFLWLMHPGSALTAKQQHEQHKIRRLLYDPDVLSVKEPRRDVKPVTSS